MFRHDGVVVTRLSVRRCGQGRKRAPANQHVAAPHEGLPRERLGEDVGDVVLRADPARTDVAELDALLHPVVVSADALVARRHAQECTAWLLFYQSN